MVTNTAAIAASAPLLDPGDSLGVIGAGVMGRALVQGILRAGLPGFARGGRCSFERWRRKFCISFRIRRE